MYTYLLYQLSHGPRKPRVRTGGFLATCLDSRLNSLVAYILIYICIQGAGQARAAPSHCNWTAHLTGCSRSASLGPAPQPCLCRICSQMHPPPHSWTPAYVRPLSWHPPAFAVRSVIASPIIRDGIAPAFTLRRGGLVAGVDVVEGCGCSRDASNVWSRGCGSPRVAGGTAITAFPLAKEALAICNCGARGFGTHGLAPTFFVCVAWSQAMPAKKASFCNEPAYVSFVESPQEKHFDPFSGYHICQ